MLYEQTKKMLVMCADVWRMREKGLPAVGLENVLRNKIKSASLEVQTEFYFTLAQGFLENDNLAETQRHLALAEQAFRAMVKTPYPAPLIERFSEKLSALYDQYHNLEKQITASLPDLFYKP